MNIAFTEWLNKEMVRKGWNQAELARQSGVARATISNLMNQVRNPGTDLLEKIAESLGYPPEFVFRMAGLLPPEKEKDPTDEELLFLFQQLSDQEKEIIRAQVRALVERNK